MTHTTLPPHLPPDRPTAAGAPRRRRNPWITALLVLVCALIAAMWVYGLWFAPRDAAYRVDDAAWRDRAQEICTRYRAEQRALADTDEGYIEEPTQPQMLQRADIVDRATDLLEAQLAELTALPLSTGDDRALVEEWAGFYRTLIADRRAYTAKLRSFVVEPYLETKVDGGPVTNVILDFTTVNEIKSCAPPGELGGDA